ncbi:MAG: FkbM family methyltransferase [Cyanobacteria bacterium]|nr:FkbM family methyltransferase [Cyanobacteriota bacterium]
MTNIITTLRQQLEQPEGRRMILKELMNDPDLNAQLLKLALHARGYNNYQNGLVSGELFLIRKVLPQLGINCCLDVGAAQGQYSRLLLQSLPDCLVYGCEPLSLNLPILEVLAHAESQRFRLWPWALGARDEELWLHYNPDILQHASLCDNLDAIDYLDNYQCERVLVRRLDTVCSTLAEAVTFDFIKIDSEGWEADVLDGGGETLMNDPPRAIQMEFNRHQMFRSQTLLSLAQRLPGYVMYQLLPNRLELRDPTSVLANIFEFSNFVFIRRDLIELIKPYTNAPSNH